VQKESLMFWAGPPSRNKGQKKVAFPIVLIKSGEWVFAGGPKPKKKKKKKEEFFNCPQGEGAFTWPGG